MSNNQYRAGGSSQCEALKSSLVRFGHKEQLVRVYYSKERDLVKNFCVPVGGFEIAG